MQCRNFCFDAFEYRDDPKLNSLVNFPEGISGTISRTVMARACSQIFEGMGYERYIGYCQSESNCS
jgi:hypothetical protein